MRAIVVGGGIGGLATARGLALRGWDVTVLERQPTLEAAGAGLSLWPNALRALDWLGLGDRVRAAGAPITGGGLRTASGTWLTRVRMTAPPVDAPAVAHPVTAPHPAAAAARSTHSAGGAPHATHPAGAASHLA
ncbi:MAG TPA: FAD-dependent oxidoreductase, partial [Dactylosporangium sp.]|nr:FAD-dependent oxidoreductase [Dactylosporangium sp.]